MLLVRVRRHPTGTSENDAGIRRETSDTCGERQYGLLTYRRGVVMLGQEFQYGFYFGESRSPFDATDARGPLDKPVVIQFGEMSVLVCSSVRFVTGDTVGWRIEINRRIRLRTFRQ